MKEMKDFLDTLGEGYKHASNFKAKIRKNDKINDLIIHFEEYKKFHESFKEFKIENIEKIVNAWNTYLSFVRTNSTYSAQSKFESTIMEEALFRIFKSYERDVIKVGGIKAYSNLYFSPADFQNFKEQSNVKINTKDQDFAIFKQIKISTSDGNEVNAFVPIVAMECKSYLDKTMLEGSIATAEKIKQGNPHCRFCIVAESYDVDYSIDINNTRIDQIYVLSKRKRQKDIPANSEIISSDVIVAIYNETSEHLNRKWSDVKSNIEKFGKVL